MTTRHTLGTLTDDRGCRAQVIRTVDTVHGESLTLTLDAGPRGYIVFGLSDANRSQLMRMLAGENASPVRLVK